MTLKDNWEYKIGWIYVIFGFIVYCYSGYTDDMQMLIVSLFILGISLVALLCMKVMDKLTAVKVEICSVQEFLERLGEIKDNSSDEQL